MIDLTSGDRIVIGRVKTTGDVIEVLNIDVHHRALIAKDLEEWWPWFGRNTNNLVNNRDSK